MKHRALSILAGIAVVTAAALAAASPARAGLDIDFGGNVPIGDNANLFFNISSRYFDREPVVVQDWSRRFPNPDDLAVFFFICEQSGKRPEMIFALRKQALTWWRIAARVGVPPDVFFVPVSRPPGPPYGRAYGYWKKHQANPKATFVLADNDVRNLVAVKVVHDYYGVSPEVAMKARASGRSVQTLVNDEYRKRHAKGKDMKAEKPGQGPHQGKGKEKKDDHGGQHGKGHENKRPGDHN